jgi:glycosyltransferase involved in cell wall biosynthesis
MPDLAIAHVSNVIGGGMGTVFRVLLPAQVERGDKVTFFVRQVGDEDRGYFAERGVEIRLIGGTRDLTRHLRHYDVVHLHSADLDLLTAGWLSGRPAVFTLHGLRAQTRGLATVSVRRLPTVAGVRRRLKRAGLSWLLRHGVRRVTTVSEFLAAKAVESYGVSRDHVTVVYSGIALDRFRGPAQPAAPRQVDAGPVLGWVGRLVPVKRVDVLLRATAALGADGGWPGLRALIVGDGELRGELERLSHSLGLAGTVQFVGQSEHPEEYLRQMDLFVFPSRDEGLGLAVSEAMAAGVPVVALQDGGGVVELVRLSGGGVVAPDEPALVEAITALLRDPDQRRRLSERAVAHAVGELGPPAWADRFDEVYREVLAGPQARAR